MEKFVNRSKSLLPKTAETVRTIWEEAVKRWEAKGIPVPNKPKYGKVEQDYDKYLFYITGYSPCPVCEGAQDRKGCMGFRVHNVLTRSKVGVGRWELLLGKLCIHGYYLAECKECLKEACVQNVEATCR